MQRNEIKFKLDNSNLIKFKNETKLFSAYPKEEFFLFILIPLITKIL